MPVQSELCFTSTDGFDELDHIKIHLVEGLSKVFRLDVVLSRTNAAVGLTCAKDCS